jgi:drug/metabolite transporter (DMT)-like permease
MNKTIQANLILITVTAMWGLTFPLIHNAVAYVSPGLFVAMRMILASLALLPFVLLRFRLVNRRLVIGCSILALLNTATYLFQSKGLMTIPASRSAFITGVSVVLVPLLMPLFRLGKPDLIASVSVLFCVVGLYILTGANIHELSPGDLWTLACAVCYAFYIIVMQIMSARATDYLLLCFFQVFFSIAFALPFAGQVEAGYVLHTTVIIALLFCSLFATSLSIYLQGRYQQYTTASKTALIFTLEPVFATIFAYFINGVVITSHVIFGGIVILLSIVLREVIQGIGVVKQ